MVNIIIRESGLFHNLFYNFRNSLYGELVGSLAVHVDMSVRNLDVDHLFVSVNAYLREIGSLVKSHNSSGRTVSEEYACGPVGHVKLLREHFGTDDKAGFRVPGQHKRSDGLKSEDESRTTRAHIESNEAVNKSEPAL